LNSEVDNFLMNKSLQDVINGSSKIREENLNNLLIATG